MKQFVLFLLVVVFVVFAGIAFAATPEENAAIVKVIEDNVKACNTEDIQLYKQTCVVTPQVEASMLNLWKTYDLDVVLSHVSVFDVDGENNIAIARAQIITIKKSGPAFKDNCVTVLLCFQIVDGRWKITGTKIEDVKYIDPSKAKDGIIDAELIRK